MLELFQDCHPTAAWHFTNCVLFYSKMKVTHTEAHVRVGVEVHVQMFFWAQSIWKDRQSRSFCFQTACSFILKKTHLEIAACCLRPTFRFCCLSQGEHNESFPKAILLC